MSASRLAPGPGQEAFIIQDEYFRFREQEVAVFDDPEVIFEPTLEEPIPFVVVPPVEPGSGLSVTIRQYHQGVREALGHFRIAAKSESFIYAANSPKYAEAIEDQYGDDLPEMLRILAYRQERSQNAARRAFFIAYGRDILYKPDRELVLTGVTREFMDKFMGRQKGEARTEELNKINAADKIING